MPWETKKFVTRFVEIFASLLWSGTDPAVSLRYACVYFCQVPRGTANFSLRSLQCCRRLYVTQIKWIWLVITDLEGRTFCFLHSGVDTSCFPLCSSEWCFILFLIWLDTEDELLGTLTFVRTPSWQAPASLEGSVVLGYKVVRLLWGKPSMVSLFGFWPLWNCATCMRSTVFFFLKNYSCFKLYLLHSGGSRSTSGGP